MPPHEYFLPDFLPGKIKYKVSDGVWCDLPVIAQAMVYDLASGRDATVTSAYWPHGDDAIEICGTFEPIPALRKRLSRKRIRKVLMSIGIPRNKADFQSRDMVQTLDMDSRKIEILAITLPGLMFWRKA